MVVSYGKLIGELSTGIAGAIIGFDKIDIGGRCVIYVSEPQTIFVQREVIELASPKALSLLRARVHRLAQHNGSGAHYEQRLPGSEVLRLVVDYEHIHHSAISGS